MTRTTTTPPIAPAEIPTDRWFGVYPAIVNELADPEALGRVKVHLPFSNDQGGPRPSSKSSAVQVWARLAAPVAGRDRGFWFRPEVGDEVLVAFERGDPAHPYVIGCMWSHPDPPPTDVANQGENSTKVLKTRNGATILLDDTEGSERVEIHTPSGVRLKMKDGPSKVSLELRTPTGQSLVLDDTNQSTDIEDMSGNTIRISPAGIEVHSTAKVAIAGSTVDIHSGMTTVHGVVKCDTLITNSVVASSYTPGAGNIW